MKLDHHDFRVCGPDAEVHKACGPGPELGAPHDIPCPEIAWRIPPPPEPETIDGWRDALREASRRANAAHSRIAELRSRLDELAKNTAQAPVRSARQTAGLALVERYADRIELADLAWEAELLLEPFAGHADT